MSADSGDVVLEGRMPVLPGERLFTRPLPFVWSCTVFGAAVWTFMVGAGLTQIGDIRVTIPGFLIGVTLGFLPVAIAGGLPSFRYGLDTMDACKATFGTRGALLPLLGLLFIVLCWSSVVSVFIGRGIAEAAGILAGRPRSSLLGLAITLAIIALSWSIVRRGPSLLERINNWAGPGLLLMTGLLLVLLIQQKGASHIWADLPLPGGQLLADKRTALVSAIELGIGISIGNFCFIGGLMRLTARRSFIGTPALMGTTLIGLGFCSAVAALVAANLGTTDPVRWFLTLGGPIFGAGLLTALLIGNVAVIGLLIYFGAVSVQQVGFIRRRSWPMIVALLLIPATIAALYPDATLSAVVGISNYQATIFVGIAGATFANYVLILRERLDLRAIFATSGDGAYAFTGGFNWIGIVAAAAGSGVYLLLYDPVTLAAAPSFVWLGASIPAFVTSAGLFLVLTRLTGGNRAIVPPARIGF